jgi:hypothetical protein
VDIVDGDVDDEVSVLVEVAVIGFDDEVSVSVTGTVRG